MRYDSGFSRACRLAGIFVLIATMAACSKTPNQQMASGQLTGQAVPGSQGDLVARAGDTVQFGTDSIQLSPAAQTTLRAQAQWLRQYPHHRIRLEGHADERGTREYNLGLGAQRATAVKNYLTRLGVGAARLRTISYGKERPVAVCDDISCWSQNRRVMTKVSGGAGS